MKRKSNIPGIIRLKKFAYNVMDTLGADDVTYDIIYRKGYSIMIVVPDDYGLSFKFVEKRKRF